MEEVNLSERKNEILNRSVEDYIQLACPITSSSIKEKHINNISTATLRNELNSLEAMGYLKQVYTSGGRVPTTKAYRHYINNLLNQINKTPEELDAISKKFDERATDITSIINEIASLIKNNTNYPTVVLFEGMEKLIIEAIKIMNIDERQAILLIKTSNGYLNNTLILNSSEKNCMEAGNFLTNIYRGKTIEYLIENIDVLKESLEKEIQDFKEIFNVLSIVLKQKYIKKLNILMAGSEKLLSSQEQGNVEKAKKVYNLLEDEENLIKIMESKEDEKDISVTLGSEETIEGYDGCAVVKAPITIGGKTVATVGVVGTERIDYLKIASAIKFLLSNNKKEGE